MLLQALTKSCAVSGFRYVEIDFGGHPHAAPTLETVTGIVLRSNVAQAATISLGSDPSHLAQRVSSNSLCKIVMLSRFVCCPSR